MSIDERLGRIDERLESIEHAVMGNHQPGLAQKVASLERWRAMLIGAWMLILAYLGYVKVRN